MKKTAAHFGMFSIALAVCFSGSVLFSGCQQTTQPEAAPALTKLSGGTMGTFYEVTVADRVAPEQATLLQTEIETLLEEINRQMSTYLPESEISRFNRSRELTWFPVSVGFARVVAESLEIAALSQGAFDPTVGPLVDLWHFGPEREKLIIPTAEEIAAVRQRTGYQHLEVRLEPPALRKKIPDLQLDLSAVAKGDAVDQVGLLLEQQGHQGYLVNIGGEILARGERTAGQSWRLAIEKPVDDRREIQQVILLKNQAMATSGDYRNFYEVEGQRYSHTINPETGRPVEHQLHSVSVLTETCARADAFATVLMVIGPDAAWEFAQTHQLEVFLIYGHAGKLVTKQTDRFPVQPLGD